jgi:hypothetical protein
MKIHTMTPEMLDEQARDWLRRKSQDERARVLGWLIEHPPAPSWKAGAVAWAFWAQSVNN